MRRFTITCLALLVSGTGCASSYKPMVTPRVQVVQTSSGLAFVREGRQYEDGLFGGGLADAVSGVPEAEAHASSYTNLRIGGFLFTLGGAASYGIAAASLVRAANEAAPGESIDLQTFNIFLASGLGLSLVGLMMSASAQPHMWDAINIHNDEVQREAVRKWRERQAPARR